MEHERPRPDVPAPRRPGHVGPGPHARRVILGAALTVAGNTLVWFAALALAARDVGPGFLFVALPGLFQTLYLVPVWALLQQRDEPELADGVLLGGIVTLLSSVVLPYVPLPL